MSPTKDELTKELAAKGPEYAALEILQLHHHARQLRDNLKDEQGRQARITVGYRKDLEATRKMLGDDISRLRKERDESQAKLRAAMSAETAQKLRQENLELRALEEQTRLSLGALRSQLAEANLQNKRLKVELEVLKIASRDTQPYWPVGTVQHAPEPPALPPVGPAQVDPPDRHPDWKSPVPDGWRTEITCTYSGDAK